KLIRKALMNNHHQPPAPITPQLSGNGLSQPPRNMTAARKLMKIMLAYSARKKMANAAPAYSTWNPATISDSPSATSNGRRFVSATPEIQYTTNIGRSGSQNQSNRPLEPAWASTMLVRLRLPASTSTHTSAMPMASS